MEVEALNSTQTAGKDTYVIDASVIQWLPVLLVMYAATSDCRMIISVFWMLKTGQEA